MGTLSTQRTGAGKRGILQAHSLLLDHRSYSCICTTVLQGDSRHNTMAKPVQNGLPTPRPSGSNLVHMTWSHLLFLHWPVNQTLLKKLLPHGLEIDTFDGRAYVSLVAFNMSGLRPVGTPSVPGLSSFLQLNARTYVTHGKESGVFFFSIDVSNAIAVWMARNFFHLPYFRAQMSATSEADKIKFKSSRTHQGARKATFDCEWIPGRPLPAGRSNDLAVFLTERGRLFTVHRGRAYENRIWHEPWTLRSARITKLETNIFEVNGLGPAQGDPLVHYCDETATEVWPQRESKGDQALAPWLDPALAPPPAT